jgi:hypothetical protein
LLAGGGFVPQSVIDSLKLGSKKLGGSTDGVGPRKITH